MSFLTFLHLTPLSAFGLVAVGLMLAFYAIEDRWEHATLCFAVACGLGSTYGFLQGAWPFGLVEGIWALVAFRKWMKPGGDPSASEKPYAATDAFMDDLLQVTKQTAPTTYAFLRDDGKPRGYVQIYIPAPNRILIHRLWAVLPGNGTGSHILRTVCDLADHHAIDVALRPLPFGAKPYPMEPEKLRDWYSRHGFVGPLKGMLRKSHAAAHAPCVSVGSALADADDSLVARDVEVDA